MNDRQLIIHVGFHKSGTTALQESFFANKSLLKEHGVFYPSFGLQAHHRVAWAIGGKRWGWKGRGGKATPYSTWIHMLIRIRFAKEARVFLSSEFFSEFSLEKIKQIQKQVKGREVKVLFTLRPFVKLLGSSYQQYLKYGLKADYVTWLHSVLDTPGVSKLSPTFWKRHMHDEVISRWVQVFGASNVTVVIANEQNPSFLYEAVSDYLSLPEGVLTQQETGSNRSLSLEEMSLLLEINKRFPEKRSWPEYLTFIRNGYVREMTDKISVKAGKDKLPTPAWAVSEGNKIAARSKEAIKSLDVKVYGDLDSLDTGSTLEGDPSYPESIDIETVAQAMLVFNAKTARKFQISWLIRGLLHKLSSALRRFRIR